MIVTLIINIYISNIPTLCVQYKIIHAAIACVSLQFIFESKYIYILEEIVYKNKIKCA